MLLVTAISILTRHNMLTVLLEYINQWQYKAYNLGEAPCPSLASHHRIFKPNLLAKRILLKFVPVSYT